MELITLLLMIGLFFGIIPGGVDCTLDAEDCATIEEASINMRDLSSLTVDNLAITLSVAMPDDETIQEATLTGSGQMAWNNGQIEMDMLFVLSDNNVGDDELQVIIKDGTAYSYDSVFDEWETTPFVLDVSNLPTLSVPEAEWNGSDGSYTLAVNSASYLTGDSFLELAFQLFGAMVAGEDTESLAGQLEDFFAGLGHAETPYAINYTIEDGYITDVQADGLYTFALLGEGTTVTFSMSLQMSNYNGDVTIEAPDISTSISLDDPAFGPYLGIPTADEGQRDIIVADDVANGVVRGVTEEGFPFIGSPDAPITIAEFADFACPHCGDYVPELEQMVGEFVRSGQLRVVYVPMTFVGQERSEVAALGALCAAEQGTFWEYHHVLYDIQDREGSPALTLDRMNGLAADFGLDTEAFAACMESESGSTVLANAETLRAETDVNATPTLIYRLGEGEWQHFVDENGDQISRQSYNVVSQLILDNQ